MKKTIIFSILNSMDHIFRKFEVLILNQFFSNENFLICGIQYIYVYCKL